MSLRSSSIAIPERMNEPETSGTMGLLPAPKVVRKWLFEYQPAIARIPTIMTERPDNTIRLEDRCILFGFQGNICQDI